VSVANVLAEEDQYDQYANASSGPYMQKSNWNRSPLSPWQLQHAALLAVVPLHALAWMQAHGSLPHKLWLNHFCMWPEVTRTRLDFVELAAKDGGSANRVQGDVGVMECRQGSEAVLEMQPVEALRGKGIPRWLREGRALSSVQLGALSDSLRAAQEQQLYMSVLSEDALAAPVDREGIKGQQCSCDSTSCTEESQPCVQLRAVELTEKLSCGHVSDDSTSVATRDELVSLDSFTALPHHTRGHRLDGVEAVAVGDRPATADGTAALTQQDCRRLHPDVVVDVALEGRSTSKGRTATREMETPGRSAGNSSGGASSAAAGAVPASTSTSGRSITPEALASGERAPPGKVDVGMKGNRGVRRVKEQLRGEQRQQLGRRRPHAGSSRGTFDPAAAKAAAIAALSAGDSKETSASAIMGGNGHVEISIASADGAGEVCPPSSDDIGNVHVSHSVEERVMTGNMHVSHSIEESVMTGNAILSGGDGGHSRSAGRPKDASSEEIANTQGSRGITSHARETKEGVAMRAGSLGDCANPVGTAPPVQRTGEHYASHVSQSVTSSTRQADRSLQTHLGRKPKERFNAAPVCDGGSVAWMAHGLEGDLDGSAQALSAWMEWVDEWHESKKPEKSWRLPISRPRAVIRARAPQSMSTHFGPAIEMAYSEDDASVVAMAAQTEEGWPSASSALHRPCSARGVGMAASGGRSCRAHPNAHVLPRIVQRDKSLQSMSEVRQHVDMFCFRGDVFRRCRRCPLGHELSGGRSVRCWGQPAVGRWAWKGVKAPVKVSDGRSARKLRVSGGVGLAGAPRRTAQLLLLM
jgi:hypothetical protein